MVGYGPVCNAANCWVPSAHTSHSLEPSAPVAIGACRTTSRSSLHARTSATLDGSVIKTRVPAAVPSVHHSVNEPSPHTSPPRQLVNTQNSRDGSVRTGAVPALVPSLRHNVPVTRSTSQACPACSTSWLLQTFGAG